MAGHHAAVSKPYEIGPLPKHGTMQNGQLLGPTLSKQTVEVRVIRTSTTCALQSCKNCWWVGSRDGESMSSLKCHKEWNTYQTVIRSVNGTLHTLQGMRPCESLLFAKNTVITRRCVAPSTIGCFGGEGSKKSVVSCRSGCVEQSWLRAPSYQAVSKAHPPVPVTATRPLCWVGRGKNAWHSRCSLLGCPKGKLRTI